MSNADINKQRNLSPYDPIEQSRYGGSARTPGPSGRTQSVANESQLSARERKRRILNNLDPFEADDGVGYQSLKW